MTADLHLASLSNPTLIPKGRIGRFVYEREIGHGSVGIVYLFRDPMIGRKVAIKVLNPKLPANQRQLFEKHFIQEARAAGRLNHPNIVTVYDADKTGDLLFIVMEYLEGKELSEMLASGHQFTYKQIADMIGRIANALDYAHENGVIHRDIKPANIFIVGTSTPKVLDFGIASASRQLTDVDATQGQDQLSERRLLGTPNYMSPEQAKSETVDARTDIFSLGVMLYQLLCGQLPFKGNDVPGLLHAITHHAAVPPQEIKSDVPLRLARIAAKALAKKPADRYQRASDMARDLNRFLEKERTERIIAKIQNPEQGKTIATKDDRIVKKTGTGSRQMMFAAAGILAVGLTLWISLKPSVPKPAPLVAAPEQAVATIPPVETTPAEKATVPLAVIEEPEIVKPATPDKKALALAKAAKAKPAPAVPKVEPVPISLGSVHIAVSPWGEVFVDGQAKGIAPPLTKLNLPVGKHKIEIKNGDDNHAVTIEVNTEKEVKIAHRF
ncbi:MAG: serine/threonine-protein kinase [Undibacterium sp.]|nr:serine/threonine-protein kinase [Undibacterium sp.]